MATQQYASAQPKGFKNHIENIAIVGATGYSGKYIVSSLLQNKAFKITAITRETGTAEMPSGIAVARVNYDNHASLVAGLQNQDALIITMGVRAPPDQQEKLIRAAAEARVPWILPNEFGQDNANEDLTKDVVINAHKTRYRALIEELGVSSWIGIACGFWYEFSLGGGNDCYGFDVKGRKVTLFDEGTQAIATSTLPQVGRGVAALLGLKVLRDNEGDKGACLNDWRNRFAYLASFVVSQRDMFDSVLRVTGTEKKDWEVGHEGTKERFARANEMIQKGSYQGMRIALYTRSFFADGSGNHAGTRGLDNEKLGLPKEDLDEFTGLAVRWALDGTLERYGQ